jgi:predicted dehydrogenase
MLAADSPMRFLVRGTEGSLLKRHGDPQEAQLVSGQQPGSPGWGSDPDPLISIEGERGAAREVATPSGNYRSYYSAMRDAIQGDGKPPVTPEQATTLMAIVEAGIQSSDEGRVVSPDYVEAERSAWNPTGHVRRLPNPRDP